MTSQCIAGRRIGELEFLQPEIKAWSDKTNTQQRGIDWHFTVDNPRTKLKRIYPQIGFDGTLAWPIWAEDSPEPGGWGRRAAWPSEFSAASQSTQFLMLWTFRSLAEHPV